ncbi:carbohydrate ABC transporter permease [Nocardioides zeicaulis]|uniref:Carbohydrate ABC transporter permease n=1 Tax=Nocardioides zeicaulis TaxID=1776857 RepID=A0ABV6DWP9_9ACTN
MAVITSETIQAETGPPKPRKQRGARFRAAPWALLPSLGVSAIFVYGFIAFSLWISFSNWKRPTARDLSLRSPLGATYKELFQEQRFQADLRNMVVFTVGFLLLAIIGGLVTAVLVDRVVIGKGLFRSVFLLPYALSFIVTGVAFRWIFNPTSGINVVLTKLGVDNPPGWTTDTNVFAVLYGPAEAIRIEIGIPVALIPIVLAAAWQLMGFSMAMYLAGLSSIPHDEMEAASVDGATSWQTLRHVILPQLWPSTVTCFVLLLHIALKIFDLVVAMSGSGPGFVTDVPGIYVFDAMTKSQRYDKGTAAALVVFALTCLVIVPYLARSYRTEKGR